MGTLLGICVVSLVYFADILIRASQKCFWFDELYTVFLCRLPTFKGTYAAVLHGADFNPPLFYLLTRASQRVFGEGLIATRLPEMLGVWLFCLCLFLFVSRRLGPLAGAIAGVLPFFTLIHYYAYEGRPHGLVLGWCGLALVFWQRAKEGRAKAAWLGGLWLCILGASLTHVYAVYLILPFLAVEVYAVWHGQSLDWETLSAILVPLLAAAPVYFPLYRAYQKIVLERFLVGRTTIEFFFLREMRLAALLLLFAIFLIAVGRKRIRKPERAARFSRPEIVLAAAFAALPLAGWAGAWLSHGRLFDRYFLSSVAGDAILLAWAISRPQLESWVIRIFAGSLLILMIANLATAVYHWRTHTFVLIEPSSGLRLTTTPNDPMTPYSNVTDADSGLDILVLSAPAYLYLHEYAPARIASRLYYPEVMDSDSFSRYFIVLEAQEHLGLKMMGTGAFLAAHHRFLVYKARNGPTFLPVSVISKAGYRLRSTHANTFGTVYEFQR